jgi:hypothetical protein
MSQRTFAAPIGHSPKKRDLTNERPSRRQGLGRRLISLQLAAVLAVPLLVGLPAASAFAVADPVWGPTMAVERASSAGAKHIPVDRIPDPWAAR